MQSPKRVTRREKGRGQMNVGGAVAWALAAAAMTTQSSDPWSRLSVRTAWVCPGFLDTRTHRWATVLKHEIVGDSAWNDAVPIVGDILKITEPLELIVVDYATAGERRRTVEPV